MVAIGCILIGIGTGLILGQIQDTIILSLVGLIVGAFLYSRMAVYIKLKLNPKVKSTIYIILGILIGIIVGIITGEMKGAVITGIGVSLVAIDMMNYRRYLRNNNSENNKI
ncbi:Uncharacterised protein [uncultured Clostridium sp.]|uniref:Permease n=1 Tax=Paeniclostridium hominis TaxID=2764329 RepID=A0ABR7K2T3_9FIRM|nr:MULTISPECIES: hypothetical protein [Paeniclostridium]MDU1539757.1 hypothetical protein [Paeniclostridium sordellii]SCI76029.1 Uncharacterised protein [uncultured Clostridium sp.]MBC6003336.1 hypothetical protein [Paeniclostridium hominis]MBC8630836.1 hypothetical protein [[Eubacterium] tenue]SCI90470.1 Uncharacterised protein [uncultured Clostridium sp.]